MCKTRAYTEYITFSIIFELQTCRMLVIIKMNLVHLFVYKFRYGLVCGWESCFWCVDFMWFTVSVHPWVCTALQVWCRRNRWIAKATDLRFITSNHSIIANRLNVITNLTPFNRKNWWQMDPCLIAIFSPCSCTSVILKIELSQT